MKNSAYLIDVRIEDGERPIHLFLVPGRSMILRFSGAVDRLTGVFNIGTPIVGYVGIERKIAGWFERQECGILGGKITRAGGHEPAVLNYVEALAGRKPDRIIGKSSVSMIRVPSGELVDITPEAGANERRDESSGTVWKGVPQMQGGRPVGTMELRLNNIIAPVPVRPYQEPG